MHNTPSSSVHNLRRPRSSNVIPAQPPSFRLKHRHSGESRNPEGTGPGVGAQDNWANTRIQPKPSFPLKQRHSGESRNPEGTGPGVGAQDNLTNTRIPPALVIPAKAGIQRGRARASARKTTWSTLASHQHPSFRRKPESRGDRAGRRRAKQPGQHSHPSKTVVPAQSPSFPRNHRHSGESRNPEGTGNGEAHVI